MGKTKYIIATIITAVLTTHAVAKETYQTKEQIAAKHAAAKAVAKAKEEEAAKAAAEKQKIKEEAEKHNH
ncbi:TPA: hypothetical protein K8163_005005 [Escherichia coli]|nr:hypothetical protein [Escherichia coli]HBI7652416.1 hypothetical protein [Escherichia coli]